MKSKEKSFTSGLTFEEIKEIHKNDTSKEALDQLHRLSLIPDYVKPKSVDEKYRRLLRDKVLKDLEVLEILKKGLENAGYIKIFNFNADKLEIHEIMKVRNWLNGKD